LLILGFAGLLASSAFGFSNDTASVTRNFARTFTLTNSSISVTCTVTNGGTNTWRGFFFGEQVPSSLSVTPLWVTVNGRNITNYVFESGLDGDVCSGCIPWRWLLETPTNFMQTNPVPPQGILQIAYSLTSASPGNFSLQRFDWADYLAPGTNAGFGYSETNNQQVLSYLQTTNPPVLLEGSSTNGYVISLQGVAGITYIVDVSSNLIAWVPLITNTSSFSFTNAPSAPGDRAFYRGRMPVGP
jgi:hypothetical protein